MHTKFLSGLLTGMLGCGISIGALAATGGQASIATGFDSTSGNYGTSSNTSILSIPVIAKYETDSWMLKLTVPYIRVTSENGVIPGVGIVSMRKLTKSSTSTQSGLGDIVAASTYYAIEGDDGTPGLDLTAKIKFPTADKNAGLGTGETDYALQVDVYQSFNKVILDGALGRKFLGSSVDLPLHDVFYGSVDAGYRASDRVTAGMGLYAAQASSDAGYNQLEFTVYVSAKIDKTKKIQGYLLKGLADGSPDTGLGVLFTFAL